MNEYPRELMLAAARCLPFTATVRFQREFLSLKAANAGDTVESLLADWAWERLEEWVAENYADRELFLILDDARGKDIRTVPWINGAFVSASIQVGPELREAIYRAGLPL